MVTEISTTTQSIDTTHAGGFTGKSRGDHMNLARTDILAGIAGYSKEEQDELLWLHGYALDVLHGSRSAAVEFVGVDWTTVCRIMQGKYEASIEKFIERVRHLRRKAELQSDTGFVETATVNKIWSVLDMARNLNAIVHISGPSGRSKTHAVKEWKRRNNHGRTVYIDCPVSGGLRGILEAIAKASGVGQGRNNNSLMEVLERSFDYRHTLIFDEVARLLPTKSANLAALEFIRRLHDVSGCGIVLVSTEVFGREMRSGKLSDWFEQLLGRIEVPLVIPFKVSRQEVAEICGSFCGDRDPSTDLIKLARDIANGPGRIRLLFTLLRHAAMLARAKKAPLDACHLQSARDFRENVNRWPED